MSLCCTHFILRSQNALHKVKCKGVKQILPRSQIWLRSHKSGQHCCTVFYRQNLIFTTEKFARVFHFWFTYICWCTVYPDLPVIEIDINILKILLLAIIDYLHSLKYVLSSYRFMGGRCVGHGGGTCPPPFFWR